MILQLYLEEYMREDRPTRRCGSSRLRLVFKCNFVTIFVQGDGAPNSAQLDLASLGGVFIVLIGIMRLL
jgi:hypothetical protein